MTIHALVRPPSSTYVSCMSSRPDRASIDVERAKKQHEGFTNLLRSLDVSLHVLPTLEEFPDSCFVEDIAIVVGRRAAICRPRYESRRGEDRDVAANLKKQGLMVSNVSAPGTIEGGDIIVAPGGLIIGRGKRTNQEGIEQLELLLENRAKIVEGYDGVHLKSVATYVGQNTFVLDPKKVDASAFRDFTTVTVDPDESVAANCITVGQRVVAPAGYPKIVSELRRRQFDVDTVDIEEFRKGDGSVTCLAVIWRD